MKKHALLILCLIQLTFSFSVRCLGQSYSIDWYKVAGGGGTSTNGAYSLSGTIGQPDASGVLTGGAYCVTGGFWSLIAIAQTAGAPTLYIHHSGISVTISWQNVGGWTLQQNANLAAPAGWSNSSGITTASGTNYLTIPNPTNNQFFRLNL